jgi:hypothetical protein
MSIAFSCACGRSLRAGPHLAGKKTKCPGCGAVLTIPAAGEEAPAAPPAPKPKPAPAAAQVTAPVAPTAAPIASAVTCTCGKRIATKPEWAGKTIKCPACENRIKVPAAAAPIVPAAAAAKPAPAKRPAPPPPPVDEDDPFGGDDSEGLPADFDPETGGYQGFSDNGDADSDDDNEAPAPRKGKQAPAKKGGSKVLFLSLVGVLLLAAAGAGYFAFFFKPEMFATGTTPPAVKPVVPVKPGAGDADDEPDPKKPLAKIGPKTSAADPDDPTEPKTPDPTDPDAKLPEPKKSPDVKGDLPVVPPPVVDDLPLPPSEKPEKKVEPKKSGLPTEAAPKFGPPPLTLPKIELDPDEPKEGPGKQSVLDFVPGDAVSFSVFRVGAFLDSPSGAKAVELAGPGYEAFTKDLQEKLKLDPKDIRTVVAAFMTVPTDPKKLQDNAIVLVETAKPFDLTPVTKDADAKFEIAGKQAFSKKGVPMILVLVSPTQIMAGPKEMVTAALTQPSKQGPLSASLKEAAASKALVFLAFQVTEEAAKLRDEKLDPVRAMLNGADVIADAVAGQVTISEDKSLKLGLKLKYADADKAEKSKKAIEELVEQGSAFLTIGKKEIEKLPQGAKLASLGKSALASIKPALEGETLTVPIDFGATIGELAEIGMSVAPMMGPPGGPKGPAPKQIEKE